MQLDPVLARLSLTLLLGGLVVLASASISMADNVAGDPFFYVGRQAACRADRRRCRLRLPVRADAVLAQTGPLMLLVGLRAAARRARAGRRIHGERQHALDSARRLNLQVSEPAGCA